MLDQEGCEAVEQLPAVCPVFDGEGESPNRLELPAGPCWCCGGQVAIRFSGSAS